MDAYYSGLAMEPRGVTAMGAAGQKFQALLDKSVPMIGPRWGVFGLVVATYAIRVYLLKGFYIVTYGLGIFNLNLVIGFLSPQVDPDSEEPGLPTKSEEEFRPFVRRLPEFKFWYGATKSFCVGFLMTFFSVFDVPVFWPILLMYWMVLFTVTMRRQIRHMIKHRYLPFSHGKKSYAKGAGGKDGAPAPKKDAK
mmetsp:Transcript_7195/g.25344  ORF Transcript_7195/g.25344 Transcript_7195/m.25344 type:complete len:194 (-) Transcript_7195:422-1003(-)